MQKPSAVPTKPSAQPTATRSAKPVIELPAVAIASTSVSAVAAKQQPATLAVARKPATPAPAPKPAPSRGITFREMPVGLTGVSMGSPARGRLVGGVQLPENPTVYTIRNPAHSFGSSHAVEQLQRALIAFRAQSGFDREILVCDMSQERGGRFRPHASHRSGRDVDIRLPLKAGVKEGTVPDSISVVDWPAAWQLVKALLASTEVKYIFLSRSRQRPLYEAALKAGETAESLRDLMQYPQHARGATLRHSNGHVKHIHVRWNCSAERGRLRDESAEGLARGSLCSPVACAALTERTSPLRTVVCVDRKRGRPPILDGCGSSNARRCLMADSNSTELGSIPISKRELSDALNGILASSLRQVCVGLALFYALLTAWYLVQLEGPAQTSMSLSTALLSFGLLVGAVWFERNQLPALMAHPAAAVIASAVILNCLFLLVSVPEGAPDHQLDDRPARVRLPAVVDAVVHRARAAVARGLDVGRGRARRAIPTGTTSASRCSRPRCSAASCCSCACAPTATSRPCACAIRCSSRTCARPTRPR